MDRESAPARRWPILAIAWAAFFALAMAWYVMPTLQSDILALYGVSPQQFRTALTLPFLVAAILAIPGGILADRIGIRRAASLGIVVAGIGILLRSQTGSVLLLLAPMVLVGVGLGLIMPNLPKLVSVWFPPEETGLATGIYNTGLMGGLSTGLVLAPLLPGWRLGNLLLGGVLLVLTVLFYIVVKETPEGVEIPRRPLLEGVTRAVRSRNTWIAAAALFSGLAGMVSFQGELPAGLAQVYSIPPSTGGQIAATITYSGIVGSLTIPTIATRFRMRKPVLLIVSVGFGALAIPVWLTGDPTLMFLGIAIGGYLAGGALPILMEVPTWLPRLADDAVEESHVGGVSGLLTSMMNLGGFVGLPLIVGPTIGLQGYTVGFIVAVGIFAFQGIFGYFLTFPDTSGQHS